MSKKLLLFILIGVFMMGGVGTIIACTTSSNSKLSTNNTGEINSEIKDEHIHNYDETVVDPTCLEQGYTLHKCSICGDEYKTDYVAANGHDYEDTIVDPDCTNKGYTVHKCKDCDDEYIDSYTNALGHTEEETIEWVTHSDCTNDNSYYKVTICSVCKEELSRELISDGIYTHDYKETVVAPTCLEQGYTLHKCSICGDEYKTDYVDANGHDYEDTIVAPDCTNKGYIIHKCKNCDDEYIDSYTDALGHTEEETIEWITHSDCTHDNSYYKVTICSVCKEELSRELISDGVYTHDYKETIVAPTCLEQGYTLHKCSICGDEYKTDYVDANGHDYEDTIVDPDCTNKGYTVHKCKDCDDEYIDSYTDALGHTEGETIEWITHSDCTHDNSYYKVTICSVCKEELSRELISDGVYTHGYVETVVAPTCLEQGYTLHKCSICGDEYKTDYVDANGHDYENTVVSVTCTTDGYTIHKCKNCDYEFTDSIVKSTGHDYDEIVVEPTCTEQGYTIYRCKNCKDEYIDSYTDALGHTEETIIEWVTHSDCDHDNSYYEVVVCSKCKEEFSRTLKNDGVYGHVYVETIVEATCTEQGYTLYVCSKCKDEYKTDYVDANGHDYEDTIVAPDCTNKGYTIHKCKNCDDEYIDSYTDALGHTEEETIEWITHSDCTHDNSYYKVTICSVCKEELSRVLVSDGVYTHDYKDTVVAPTCIEQGYTLHKCSICGDEYKTDYVDANGHDYEDTIVAPDCTNKGYTIHKCKNCDDEYIDSYTDALGHTEGETIEWITHSDCTHDNSYYKVTICSVCKEELSRELISDGIYTHDYKETVVAPTCLEQGYTLHKCSICGDEYKTDYVDANGHDYEDTIVAPDCTNKGYTVHKCKNCDDEYIDSYTDALGHTEGETIEWVTHSDCTHDNLYYKVTICSVCEEELSRELISDGVYTHDYKETVVAPTCLEQGYTLHKCSICGDEYKTDYVDANGHDYEDTLVAPDCTNKGYTIHKCKNCDDEYIDSYTDALGHTEEETIEWITHSDCTHDNSYYKVTICSVCKEELSRELISDGVYTHDYVETVVAPTCLEQGYTLHKCSICGDEYKTDYVDANGHSYVKTIVDPTETDDGYTIYKCSECEYEYISDYVEKTGYVITLNQSSSQALKLVGTFNPVLGGCEFGFDFDAEVYPVNGMTMYADFELYIVETLTRGVIYLENNELYIECGGLHIHCSVTEMNELKDEIVDACNRILECAGGTPNVELEDYDFLSLMNKFLTNFTFDDTKNDELTFKFYGWSEKASYDKDSKVANVQWDVGNATMSVITTTYKEYIKRDTYIEKGDLSMICEDAVYIGEVICKDKWTFDITATDYTYKESYEEYNYVKFDIDGIVKWDMSDKESPKFYFDLTYVTPARPHENFYIKAYISDDTAYLSITQYYNHSNENYNPLLLKGDSEDLNLLIDKAKEFLGLDLTVIENFVEGVNPEPATSGRLSEDKYYKLAEILKTMDMNDNGFEFIFNLDSLYKEDVDDIVVNAERDASGNFKKISIKDITYEEDKIDVALDFIDEDFEIVVPEANYMDVSKFNTLLSDVLGTVFIAGNREINLYDHYYLDGEIGVSFVGIDLYTPQLRAVFTPNTSKLCLEIFYDKSSLLNPGTYNTKIELDLHNNSIAMYRVAKYTKWFKEYTRTDSKVMSLENFEKTLGTQIGFILYFKDTYCNILSDKLDEVDESTINVTTMSSTTTSTPTLSLMSSTTSTPKLTTLSSTTVTYTDPDTVDIGGYLDSYDYEEDDTYKIHHIVFNGEAIDSHLGNIDTYFKVNLSDDKLAKISGTVKYGVSVNLDLTYGYNSNSIGFYDLYEYVASLS